MDVLHPGASIGRSRFSPGVPHGVKPKSSLRAMLGFNSGWGYMGLLEQLPLCRGFWSFSRQKSPWLQVPCLPLAWVKQRDHFCTCWELESGPVSLTAIPFPAGALPNRMLQYGKVTRQGGFKPCSHCGCCLVGSEPDLGYGTQPHLWMQSAHQLQQQLMDTPVY